MYEIYKLIDKIYREIDRMKKSGVPESFWKKALTEIKKFEKAIENCKG